MGFLIGIITAIALMIPIGCCAQDFDFRQRQYIIEAIKDIPMYIGQAIKCDKECNCWVIYGEDSPEIRKAYRKRCLDEK